MANKLSGDVAYERYVSSEPFPLHDLLEEWKDGTFKGGPGYILAIIKAYDRMVIAGKDGRYGIVR